jgi:protein TonB
MAAIASGGAPLRSPPVTLPQPIEASSQKKPEERPRPKIARKAPKPRADEPMPAPAAAPPVAANEAPPTAIGGVQGGVIGGEEGGKIGGVVGGQGDKLFRPDQVASVPVPISQALPDYPPLARARGVEGLVIIEAVIDRRGLVEHNDIRVVQSVPPLDQAAVAALEQWRFRPGRDRNGDAVRVLVEVPIRFRLR